MEKICRQNFFFASNARHFGGKYLPHTRFTKLHSFSGLSFKYFLLISADVTTIGVALSLK